MRDVRLVVAWLAYFAAPFFGIKMIDMLLQTMERGTIVLAFRVTVFMSTG